MTFPLLCKMISSVQLFVISVLIGGSASASAYKLIASLSQSYAVESCISVAIIVVLSQECLGKNTVPKLVFFGRKRGHREAIFRLVFVSERQKMLIQLSAKSYFVQLFAKNFIDS